MLRYWFRTAAPQPNGDLEILASDLEAFHVLLRRLLAAPVVEVRLMADTRPHIALSSSPSVLHSQEGSPESRDTMVSLR
jgi:hypothetical protein